MRPKHRLFIILLLLFALLLSWLGLNDRQLIAAWTIGSETQRLEQQAANASVEFQNPQPGGDHFEERLSTQFWKFSLINGAGQISNEPAWHAASMTVDHGLAIHHAADPDFQNESADPFQIPAAGRYNNLSLIGGSGFRPTPTEDVVLEFSARISEDFYGTAGVVFEPEGTLLKDGLFAQPFDMFGFAALGPESSLQNVRGPLCYLALAWTPVQTEALAGNAHDWHDYEIRLHWNSQTEWSGSVSVDGTERCRMSLPAFGPVEVQVWSDNYWLTTQLHRWWEIAPALEMGFQDGGEKQYELGSIQIHAETR